MSRFLLHVLAFLALLGSALRVYGATANGNPHSCRARCLSVMGPMAAAENRNACLHAQHL